MCRTSSEPFTPSSPALPPLSYPGSLPRSPCLEHVRGVWVPTPKKNAIDPSLPLPPRAVSIMKRSEIGVFPSPYRPASLSSADADSHREDDRVADRWKASLSPSTPNPARRCISPRCIRAVASRSVSRRDARALHRDFVPALASSWYNP